MEVDRRPPEFLFTARATQRLVSDSFCTDEDFSMQNDNEAEHLNYQDIQRLIEKKEREIKALRKMKTTETGSSMKARRDSSSVRRMGTSDQGQQF